MGRLTMVVAPLAALPAAADPAWLALGPDELAYCAGRRRAGEHLAARALARSSVARALGWPEERTAELWLGVSVRRAASGRPQVVLSGAVAEWRRRHGLPVPGVSLSHARGFAGALAWLPTVDGGS